MDGKHWPVLATSSAGFEADVAMGVGGWFAGPAKVYHEMYACPNVRTTEVFAYTHTGAMASFRAPGHVEGAFGLESARSLAALCYRKAAKVEWMEKKRRVHFGQVTCEDKDAAAEQVRHGMAWVSPRQMTAGSALPELEAYARLRKVGLWADEKPVPPWEWRKE